MMSFLFASFLGCFFCLFMGGFSSCLLLGGFSGSLLECCFLSFSSLNSFSGFLDFSLLGCLCFLGSCLSGINFLILFPEWFCWSLNSIDTIWVSRLLWEDLSVGVPM